MGILSNTVNIFHSRVEGDIPSTADLFQWASERLALNGFRSIDQGTAELSVGWVQVDDHRDSGFSTPSAFWRDHYLVFTLRRDQRRIPAALLKAYQQVAENEYLIANPGLNRVPKQKREELREAVRASLLAKTLPMPSTWDAVWDLRSGLLTFTCLTPAVVDLFEAQFKKTFDGLRLTPVHPYARAEQLTDESSRHALVNANQASTQAALDLIKSNRWIGWDFLLWLLYKTLNDSSEYRVSRPGPDQENEPFTAYLDNRLVLFSENENGIQKITVAGPQDRFSEVRAALSAGKRIMEATIHLEKDELLWKMTLKGEMFHFASFKAPSVRIEKDGSVDAASEREAVFYERMYVLEHGLQLFDSLFATFLGIRLDSSWNEEQKRIEDWLKGE
jgi:hypothetical protein